MIEWGYFGANEEKIHKWHMAHEYGHLLSSDGTSARRLLDQYSDQPSGIYNIMHYQHFNVTQPAASLPSHLPRLDSRLVDKGNRPGAIRQSVATGND